jgi:HSP20 family protein
MTLVKFRPAIAKDYFRDTVIPSQMMSVIDSMFNNTAAKFERNVFFTPRADVIEKAASFEIHIALPGLTKEEIAIEVNGDQLHVKGERKVVETKEGEHLHISENYYGKFSRTFNLPENVNTEAVEAVFNNGILNITLPKTTVKEVKNIIKIK